MTEPATYVENLWKFKRYLHLGFETLERLKTGDDLKNMQCLVNLIKINYGLSAVETIKKISEEGNLINRTHLITALAVCARQTFDLKTKAAAYGILKEVCLNPEHLFYFLSKCELFGFLLLHAGELQALGKVAAPKKESLKTILGAKAADTNPPRILSAHKENQIPNRIPSAHKKEPHLQQQTPRVPSAHRVPSASSSSQKEKLTLPVISSPVNTPTSHAQIVKKEEDLKLPSISNTKVETSAATPRILSASKGPKTLEETHTVEPKDTTHIKADPVVPANPNLAANSPKHSLNTGWGKAHKKAINKWYQSLKPMEFAVFLTKYPKKNKWTHRDVFR